MIWVTSDWHFGHDREFIYKPRGFSSVEEMNEEIIKRHNSIVAPDDDVICLGDLMLGDNAIGLDCLRRLNGNINVVRGNHDTDKRVELYRALGIPVDNALYIKYKGYHFYLSHYPTLTGNLEKESLRQMTLNLYGHTHQSNNFYNDKPYMFHCGVDSHACYPVDLDQIIQAMQDKVTECMQYL